MAPRRPNQRLPRTIEALPRFGPGSTWQRPMVSVKSACVSQRRSSTIAWYAHGSTPPNERAPMERKPRNSSPRSRGGVTPSLKRKAARRSVSFPSYMDASRSASILTLRWRRAGVAVLYPAYSAKRLPCGLDGFRNRHLISLASSKLRGKYRFESIPGHPVCHHSVKSLAQPVDDPPSVKWLIGYAACAP